MIQRTTVNERLANSAKAATAAIIQLGAAASQAASEVELSVRAFCRACSRIHGLPGSDRTNRLRKKRRKAIERMSRED